MRVALLTHQAQAGDAIGNQVAEKLGFFLDSGADVRVFVESDQKIHPLVRPHCRLLDAREPRGEGWNFLASADVVIADYSQAYALLGLLPLLSGGRPRIVLDYHGVTPPELWGENRAEALREGVRQRGLVWCADAALTHSRFTRRELLDPTRFPAERVATVGLAVPAETWSSGAPERDLRVELGLGQSRVLLYVGRLAPNKRVPVLVEALALLQQQTPPVHAVVIGDASDVYEVEACRCREWAADLGVADRLHILGQLSTARLRDAYRSADVFVMPSRHEGFCVPVIEAMACGVPVVAARAAALPETVAHAGLTFTPDDATDLARQITRVLQSQTKEGGQRSEERGTRGPLRVAVVSYRYGLDFVGGAERSLRTIAETLHRAGHQVEVFATCTRAESNWTDHYPEGEELIAGVSVRRYRVDAHDRVRHVEAVRAILQSGGNIAAQVEEDFLANSIHSRQLLDAVRQRLDEFDVIITGPYLAGLTHEVARAFPDKTLLLPCFHDEPLARLRVWRATYGQVGGILYHSPEEQDLAERKLGFNHPGGYCIGSWLDAEIAGDPRRGRAVVGGAKPYVVYCGRYSLQKGLPALLDCARQYSREHPERFTFVFMGEGSVAIPREPWARDLGYVDEEMKRDVLAGASALVQLSPVESLSLAALDAWAQGVPVLVNRRCQALVGHLQRGGGGRVVEDAASLSAALDDLARDPASWQALGVQGRRYVQTHYGSAEPFTRSLLQAMHAVRLPLAERMRRCGFDWAARFDRPTWRQRFAEVLEQVLDAPTRSRREQIEVVPRCTTRTIAAGTGAVLVPVRVVNQGTHAAVAEGPARVVLRSAILGADGQVQDGVLDTPLPGLLMPGQTLAAAVPVSVPSLPGTYRVVFQAQSVSVRQPVRAATGDALPLSGTSQGEHTLTLLVEDGTRECAEQVCAPLLDTVQAALAEAHRVQRLPDEYSDVSSGRFAAWKRWIKQKLLGNFQRAYVDVLSRQQSAFNQGVLSALSELAECCATLDHARIASQGGAMPQDFTELVRQLTAQLGESRQMCARLQERLDRLEAGAPTNNTRGA